MSATTPPPLDLDALARLESRATDAPWRVVLDDSENATTVWQVCTSPDHPTDDDPDHIVVYDCCTHGGLHGEPWYREADADFVAALRNAAPELIQAARERDAARAEVARLRETLREVLGSFYEHGHPGVECRRTGWIQVDMLARWRAALSPDAPVEPERNDLRPILAAVDNALRNGSYMTGANYAFALLCDHLGVERDALDFRPDWKRPAADGGEPR